MKSDFYVIMESGNNENGNYIKYANGLLVCNQRFSRSVAISTAWGSLYRSDSIDCPNYPVPFTAIYSSVCDVTGVNTAIVVSWADGSFNVHGRLVLIRPVSVGSQSYEINITTVGSWK